LKTKGERKRKGKIGESGKKIIGRTDETATLEYQKGGSFSKCIQGGEAQTHSDQDEGKLRRSSKGQKRLYQPKKGGKKMQTGPLYTQPNGRNL